MEPKTYFEHYRVCTKKDGSPRELGRVGDATAYKAVDIRSGEPAALRLIPVATVDPAIREQFEEQARALAALDHINIARVFAFGTEDNHFVFLSEFLQGQTIESWVWTHGPMPPEAVLRVALQVVGALGAASFHRLTHRAIQPSNLMIVPGQTIEGGWPFVKLTNFSVAGLTFGLEDEANLSASPHFASPEQLQQGGVVDFPSEIYSLGAAMGFMLTGMAHPPETFRKQIRRFPKAMRALLARMLRENPAERPHDNVSLTEEIRDCLQKIDRRQMLAQRLGIALPPAQRRIEQPRFGLSRKVLALAALVLALTVAAGALLPQKIKTLLHLNSGNEVIGVPVGVSETARAPFVQNVSRVAPRQAAPSSTPTNSPVTESVAASSSAHADTNQDTPPSIAQAAPSIPPQPSAPISNPAIATGPNISSPAPTVANNASPSEPPPPTEGPDDGSVATKNSSGQQGSSIAQSNSEPPNSAPSHSSSVNNDRAESPSATTSNRRSTSKRARIAEISPNESEGPAPRFPPGTVRLKFVGMTPDGRVRLQLPSGRIVVVTPRGEEDVSVQHRYRRGLIERREIPPPPSIYPPDE
jgi:serine/threonine protein kinase